MEFQCVEPYKTHCYIYCFSKILLHSYTLDALWSVHLCFALLLIHC